MDLSSLSVEDNCEIDRDVRKFATEALRELSQCSSQKHYERATVLALLAIAVRP